MRVTEHRITLTEEGGGEARLILADIRSDGIIDSLVVEDFQKMMLAYEGPGIEDFERKGKMVTSKRLYANGDTLSGELTYTFELRSSIEGLHIKGDEMFIVVGRGGRVIEKTNGSVEEWRGGQRNGLSGAPASGD